MNRAEAVVDRLDPRLSVRLRLLKKAAGRDLLLALIRRLVGPGDVVLDIGANRGVYTLALSRRVGPAGRVHSFDPVPVNIDSLRTLARTRRNVEVHPVALSDHDGTADLHVPLDGTGRIDALARVGSRPDGEHDTMEVPLATIDGRFDGWAGRAPTFVKCDVEGHEHEVLLGGKDLFASHRPALVVEIEQRHRHEDVHTTIEQLLAWGYDGYSMTARRLAPIADFDVERDQLALLSRWTPGGPAPAAYVGNFLFVPPGTELGGVGGIGGVGGR